MQRSMSRTFEGLRIRVYGTAAVLAVVATCLLPAPALGDEAPEWASAIDLTYPGLGDVADKLAEGDESGASAALREYYIGRTDVKLPTPSGNGLGDMTAEEIAVGVFRYGDETRDFYNEDEGRIDVDWSDAWGGTTETPGAPQTHMADFTFMPILLNAYLDENDPEVRAAYAAAWMDISLDFFEDNPEWVQNRNLAGAKRLAQLANTFSVFHADPAIDAADSVAYLSGVHHTTDRLAQALQIHGGNNWYVSMSRSIYISSVYFPEFLNSAGWEHFATRSVEWFVTANVKSDSIYREPAFNYQAYVSDVINTMSRVASLNGRTLPPKLIQASDWIADSLFATRMPNFQTPLVGDSPHVDAGIADIRATGERQSWQDFQWVGSRGAEGTPPNLGSTIYPTSFAVQRSGWDADARYMMINNQNTNYTASHRHPDDLSVVMAAYGRPLIVDPGADTYSDTELNNWMRRTTEAHNTIEVDGRPQDPGVARISSLWRSNEGLDIYRGSAEGYRPIDHDRVVYFVKPGFWIVSDALTGGTEAHDFRQLWHFPGDPVSVDPETNVATVGFDTVPGGDPVSGVQLAPVGAGDVDVTATIHEDGLANVNDEMLSDIDYLSYDWTAAEGTGVDTVVFPGAAGAAPSVNATRIDMPGVEHAVATALEIDLPAATGRFYLSREESPSERTFGDAVTDAETAYLERDGNDVLTRYSMTAGSDLLDSGGSIIDASDPVSDISVGLEAGIAHVSLSDPFDGTLSLWAPDAEVVLVNGEATEFTRDGDTVLLSLGSDFDVPAIFEDDFNDADLSRIEYGVDTTFESWRPVEGEWETGAQLTQNSTADHPSVAVQYDAPDAVALTAEIEPGLAEQATTRTGLAFRYQDASNYYRADVLNTPSGATLQLIKVFKGQSEILAEKQLDLGAGAAHTLTVSAVGKEMTAAIGDTSISAQDTRFPSGGVAAYTHRRAAVFTSITVAESIDETNWRGIGGDVSVSDGQLRIAPVDGRAHLLAASTLPLRFSESCDYSVATTMTLNGTGAAGISLRDSSDAYGYRINIGKTDRNTRYASIVREAHRSGPVTLATAPVTESLNGQVELDATVQGDRITVTLNGTEILQARDTLVRSGGVGLHATMEGVFDGIRISGDCSTGKPAKPAPGQGALSHDNGWDTGLQDGDYTVTMDLWSGQNANAFRLYENGTPVATVPLTEGGVSPQQATVPISGRADGTYVYTGELINGGGVTATDSVTVEVTQAKPGATALSHDNHDGDGTYTLTGDMWWGTNATSYRFLEGDTVVAEGTLPAATPAAQKVTTTVSEALEGEHVYQLEFSNAAGTTLSSPVTVVVEK